MSQRELTAAGLTSPRLRRAYAACNAYLHQRNSAAFPAIRVLLPPGKRPYWDAALAFCTHVDDILDDPATTVERRLARYSAYEQDLYRLMAGEGPVAAGQPGGMGGQLALAFQHFVRTWGIPESSVRRFMTTIRTDLEVTEYPRYVDLAEYIEGVCVQGTLWGNTLLEPRDEEAAARAAGAASFALQLTDYLQDLGEDLGDGRLYLPLEELEAFGLGRADIEQAARDRRMTPALRELVEYQVRRARRYFDEAADWWRLVDPSGCELPRQCVRLGRISLDRIERSRYDIFRLPRRVALACSAASCAEFAAGYLRKTAAAGRARGAAGRARRDGCPAPGARRRGDGPVTAPGVVGTPRYDPPLGESRERGQLGELDQGNAMYQSGIRSQEDVQELYDRASERFAVLYDDNLHFGYWDDDADDSLAAATDRMTDLYIEALATTPGRRVLDVGCGTGRPALRLAGASGAEIVGISLSDGEVKRANERSLREGRERQVRFERADAMALPYGPGSFDDAWALESLGHMPDRAQALREIARVLRPGGRLVIADGYCYEGPVDAAGVALMDRLCAAFRMVPPPTLDGYADLLAAAGFTVVERRDLSPHARRSMTRLIEIMEEKSGEMAPLLEEEAFARLLETLQAAAPSDLMGYVLLTAQRH